MQSVCQRFWYQKVSSGPVFLFLWIYSLYQRVSSGLCLLEFGCQSIASDSFVRCIRGFKV